MENVELVIQIPRKTYNALTHTEFDASLVVDEMQKAIVNGKPIFDVGVHEGLRVMCCLLPPKHTLCAREEYALEVRVNDNFDRQIDVYSTIHEAEAQKKKLQLGADETADIVRIKYDNDGNEISAQSIY